MVFSIDPNVKGAISESFDKSHLSESFDVPAGCLSMQEALQEKASVIACEVQLPADHLSFSLITNCFSHRQ